LEHRGEEIGEDEKDRITTLHDLNNPELPSPRVREATTEPDGSYYSYEAAKAGNKSVFTLIGYWVNDYTTVLWKGCDFRKFMA
jgi:hypothetical protein